MIAYDHVTNEFSDTINGRIVTIPFQYSNQTATGSIYDINKASDYDIVPLYKNGITSIEAAEVLLTSRIGCLIPELSLKTPIAEIENKPLFRFYAFLATRYLLENYDDYYSDADCDKRVFLIVEKTNITNVFSLVDFCYGLYYQGLYLRSDKTNTLCNNALPNRIKCKTCVTYLKQNTYILSYLDNLFYESDVIRLFLYGYQIIEILIDDVLIDKLNDMINKCTKGELSLRSNIDESTELSRIKKLLTDTQTINRPNLNQDCINFLLLIGRTANSIQGFPDSLYQVRNALVHRLRLLLGNTVALNELKKVNEGFELLLLDILSSYHPSTTLTLDTEYTFFKDILMEKSR